MSANGRNGSKSHWQPAVYLAPVCGPKMRQIRSSSRRRRRGGGGGKKLPAWAVTGVLAATFIAVAVYSPPNLAELPAYYPNCDAARAAGVAPINQGEAGYRGPLDADGDGIACEPY